MNKEQSLHLQQLMIEQQQAQQAFSSGNSIQGTAKTVGHSPVRKVDILNQQKTAQNERQQTANQILSGCSTQNYKKSQAQQEVVTSGIKSRRSQRLKQTNSLSPVTSSSLRRQQESVSPTVNFLSSSHNSQNIMLNIQSQAAQGSYPTGIQTGSRRSQKYKKRAKSGGDSSQDASVKSTSLAQRLQSKDINVSQNQRQKSSGTNKNLKNRHQSSSFIGNPINIIQNVYSTSSLLTKRLSSSKNPVQNEQKYAKKLTSQTKAASRTIDQDEQDQKQNRQFFSQRDAPATAANPPSSSCEKSQPKTSYTTFAGGSSISANNNVNKKSFQGRVPYSKV